MVHTIRQEQRQEQPKGGELICQSTSSAYINVLCVHATNGVDHRRHSLTRLGLETRICWSQSSCPNVVISQAAGKRSGMQSDQSRLREAEWQCPFHRAKAFLITLGFLTGLPEEFIDSPFRSLANQSTPLVNEARLLAAVFDGLMFM